MIASSINYMSDGSVRVQFGNEWKSFDSAKEFDEWKEENFNPLQKDENQLELI